MKLEKTLFTGSDFSYAPLKGLDFSACEFSAIQVSEPANELKGVVVDLYQAAELSRLLGITIKD
jgi:uncharacterized protein YjbI with pentapeptide repeats